MITEKSFVAACDLALQFHANKQVVSTKPNTPLNEICRFSSVDGSTVFTADTPFTTNEDKLAVGNLLQQQTDITTHNERYELFAKQITDSINTSNAYTRNTIVATIERVSGKVMNWLQQLDTDPISKFQVVQDKLPDPMTADSFLDMLEKDNSSLYSAPERFFNLPIAGPNWVLDFLLTGSASIDNKIKNWAVSKGDTFLVDTWKKYFTDSFNFHDAIHEYLKDIELDKDIAMFIYLAAYKLHNDPPEEISISLKEFNETVVQYRESAAKELLKVYARYKENRSAKILITTIKYAENKIFVHPDIYLDWIKEGNVNEVLFGSLIDRSTYFYVRDIEEHKEELLRVWNTYAQVTRSKFKNTRFAAFLNILQSVIISDIANKSEEEEAFFAANQNAIDTITKRLEEELQIVALDDLDDIHRVVTRLVCNSRYYYTNAFAFLVSMDEAMKTNKDITAEEAALLATIESICDFLSEQMVIRTDGNQNRW